MYFLTVVEASSPRPRCQQRAVWENPGFSWLGGPLWYTHHPSVYLNVVMTFSLHVRRDCIQISHYIRAPNFTLYKPHSEAEWVGTSACECWAGGTPFNEGPRGLLPAHVAQGPAHSRHLLVTYPLTKTAHPNARSPKLPPLSRTHTLCRRNRTKLSLFVSGEVPNLTASLPNPPKALSPGHSKKDKETAAPLPKRSATSWHWGLF